MMKIRISKYQLFLTFFGVSLTLSSAWGLVDSAASYLTKRTVEIEWDVVPEATRYDLEIYDGKNKKFIKTFVSKTNVFKLNVKMGKYYFRSRIFDRFGRSSEWTDMADLLIAPPPTKFRNPMPQDPLQYADKKTGYFELPLAWDPLPGIEVYKISLESPEGKPVMEFNIKGTSAVAKVPPGEYQFRVKAILEDGTIGDPSEATPVISVLGAKIQAPRLVFKRETEKPPKVAVHSELATALFDGELLYMPLEGTIWKKVKDLKDLPAKAIELDASYRPGQYKMKLQAKAKGFTPSEYGEVEFVLKPTEAALLPIPEEARAAMAGRN